MRGSTLKDDRTPVLRRYLDAVGELRKSSVELVAIDQAIAATYGRSPLSAHPPVTAFADHPAPAEFLQYFGGGDWRAEVDARRDQLIGRTRVRS